VTGIGRSLLASPLNIWVVFKALVKIYRELRWQFVCNILAQLADRPLREVAIQAIAWRPLIWLTLCEAGADKEACYSNPCPSSAADPNSILAVSSRMGCTIGERF
jgi:hypothetical protein